MSRLVNGEGVLPPPPPPRVRVPIQSGRDHVSAGRQETPSLPNKWTAASGPACCAARRRAREQAQGAEGRDQDTAIPLPPSPSPQPLLHPHRVVGSRAPQPSLRSNAHWPTHIIGIRGSGNSAKCVLVGTLWFESVRPVPPIRTSGVAVDYLNCRKEAHSTCFGHSLCSWHPPACSRHGLSKIRRAYAV